MFSWICTPAVLTTLAGGAGAGLTSPGPIFQEPLAAISDDITEGYELNPENEWVMLKVWST